jgi:hypothetical protein
MALVKDSSVPRNASSKASRE